MTELSCEQFRETIHPLLDGELSQDEQSRMQEHMITCADCRDEYEQLSAVKDMLAHMDDDLEVPIEFEQGWRKAIRQESRLRSSRRWVKVLSGIAAGFMLLAGATVINRYAPGGALNKASVPEATELALEQTTGELAGITGLALTSAPPQNDTQAAGADLSDDSDTNVYRSAGSGAKTSPDSNDDQSEGDTQAQYSYSSEDNLGPTSSGGLLDVNSDSDSSTTGTMKVLRSAMLNIETEKFDDDMTLIKSAVAKFGGLFERNAVSGDSGSRRAELTLRIPAGFLETFVEQLRGIGHVLESDVSAQDITSQYSDSALRLDTLRTQLTRVKELTSQAKDLNEVLELEQEASRLQYDIDTLTGTLKGWDSQIEMSTVTVVLSEYSHVDAAFSSSGFTSQISDQFSASMQTINSFLGDMMLTLVAMLPYLIWIVPLAILAWLSISFIKKGGFSKRRHAQ